MTTITTGTTGIEGAEAVRTQVAAVAHHIDAKRWDDLRALFAAEVRTDYTSLFGGRAQLQGRDALVDGWRGMLGGVATQHLLGPIVVDGADDERRATCHVRALHHVPAAPGGDTWEVLGHYELTLARAGSAWAITALTLRVFAQLGDARLLEAARAAT